MKQAAKLLQSASTIVEMRLSLILGRINQALPDYRAAKENLVRIVDESGDDYLFDNSQFVFVDFAQAVRRKILAFQKGT